MASVNSVGSDNYLSTVLQATKRNTLTHLADAKQSGTPVDVTEVKASNQQLREDAKEVGATLYSRNVKLQTLETYTSSAQNAPSYSNDNNSANTTSEVSSFDAAAVNDARQTAQERALKVALYENTAASGARPGGNNPSNPSVSVFV